MTRTTTNAFLFIMAALLPKSPCQSKAEIAEHDNLPGESPHGSTKLFVGSIAQQLREYADNVNDFTAAYPKWKSYRKKNLENLEEAKKSLNSVHHNANVAQVAASVGGFLSGCVGITGAILMRRGNPASVFQLTEKVGSLSSSVLRTGASITEAAFSKSYIDGVRRMLQEDDKLFAPIRKWFADSQELMSAIEKLCGFDTMQFIFQKLSTLDPQVETPPSQIKKILQEIHEEMQKRKISFINMEKVIELCILISRNPRLLRSMEKIKNLYLIVPFITPLLKEPMLVPRLMFMSRDVSRLRNKQIPKVKSESSSNNKIPPQKTVIDLSSGEKKPIKGATMYGVFQGVTVASELFSLYNLYQDISDGSTSEYSHYFEEVKDLLKWELDLVSEVHEKFSHPS